MIVALGIFSDIVKAKQGTDDQYFMFGVWSQVCHLTLGFLKGIPCPGSQTSKPLTCRCSGSPPHLKSLGQPSVQPSTAVWRRRGSEGGNWSAEYITFWDLDSFGAHRNP